MSLSRKPLIGFCCLLLVIYYVAFICNVLEQGSLNLSSSVMAFTMTGLVFCWLLLCRHQMLTMNRLESLNAQVKRISRQLDPSHRVEIDEMSDEIGGLAASINGMLDSLEASQRALSECEQQAGRLHVEQFRQLNSELSRKACDLAAVNRELEAFNYSVSHDMRGPLTRICGYCQLMLEDTERLNTDFREYLTRIYESSCWLDEMADAMLELSRLTRAEFNTESVDLSSIVSELIAELMMAEPGRVVETHVEQEIFAEGDFNLLKIVMSNLIGNAWKYTAGKEKTYIQFGMQKTDRDMTYFVRDNGVGFETKNSAKLFRVFTRLHSSSQFAGSGIGLATVQRIISRHGGRVWAEGQPGKGATFFFTLGDNATISPP